MYTASARGMADKVAVTLGTGSPVGRGKQEGRAGQARGRGNEMGGMDQQRGLDSMRKGRRMKDVGSTGSRSFQPGAGRRLGGGRIQVDEMETG